MYVIILNEINEKFGISNSFEKKMTQRILFSNSKCESIECSRIFDQGLYD